MSDEPTKKRGRPRTMTSEESAAAKREYQRNYAKSERGRASQHTRQKAYRQRKKLSGEQGYHISLTLPESSKNTIADIAKRNNTTVADLFINAFEDKYDVTIRRK